jgi:hypothetical protein
MFYRRLDKETWLTAVGRRRSSIPMRHRQTGEDPKLRRARKDQANTRNSVSIARISLLALPHSLPHSHAVRVSPQFSNRMIEASRSILNRYIPDIYVYSDVYKGEESGK